MKSDPAATARFLDGTREIHYRLARRPLQGRPGQHRSRAPGAGLDVHGFAPLVAHPDARRLDLHVSARDPLGRWMVRLPRQRAAATLVVLADLSASMTFGQPRKLDALADLLDALGHSAWRGGDAVAFAAADDALREAWTVAPTRSRGTTVELARRLRDAQPQGRGAGAIALAAQRFGHRRDALFFLASDFHWPATVLDSACAALAAREVVPVVLWSPREFDRWPRRGMAGLQDLESAEVRTVWFRPALAEAMARAGRERRAQLRRRFARHGWRPFFCEGAFDAEALNAYFQGEDRP